MTSQYFFLIELIKTLRMEVFIMRQSRLVEKFSCQRLWPNRSFDHRFWKNFELFNFSRILGTGRSSTSANLGTSHSTREFKSSSWSVSWFSESLCYEVCPLMWWACLARQAEIWMSIWRSFMSPPGENKVDGLPPASSDS